MLTNNCISSLVIDTLFKKAYGRNMMVLSLYCDYQAQKDQSAVNMIGGLLRQVALAAVGNMCEIQHAFEKSKQGGGKGLRLPEMLILFIKTIGPKPSIYLHRRNGRISARTSIRDPPRATTNYSGGAECTIISHREAAHSRGT